MALGPSRIQVSPSGPSKWMLVLSWDREFGSSPDLLGKDQELGFEDAGCGEPGQPLEIQVWCSGGLDRVEDRVGELWVAGRWHPRHGDRERKRRTESGQIPACNKQTEASIPRRWLEAAAHKADGERGCNHLWEEFVPFHGKTEAWRVRWFPLVTSFSVEEKGGLRDRSINQPLSLDSSGMLARAMFTRVMDLLLFHTILLCIFPLERT